MLLEKKHYQSSNNLTISYVEIGHAQQVCILWLGIGQKNAGLEKLAQQLNVKLLVFTPYFCKVQSAQAYVFAIEELLVSRHIHTVKLMAVSIGARFLLAFTLYSSNVSIVDFLCITPDGFYPHIFFRLETSTLLRPLLLTSPYWLPPFVSLAQFFVKDKTLLHLINISALKIIVRQWIVAARFRFSKKQWEMIACKMQQHHVSILLAEKDAVLDNRKLLKKLAQLRIHAQISTLPTHHTGVFGVFIKRLNF